eukprot:scaffold8114_cov126-Cylindrotheca_fusiformis.AAC.15
MIRPSLPVLAAEKGIQEENSSNNAFWMKRRTDKRRRRREWWFAVQRFLPVASLAAYLIAWVANGLMLQGITSGFGDHSVSFNRPAAITWFSYNFMSLSAIVVWAMLPGKQSSVRHFCLKTWAGELGIQRAIQRCAVIAYMLILLNVFMVMGLECISVSLSNVVYQIQTPVTMTLSFCCLGRKEKCLRAEMIGIAVSLAGILLIVVPPLSSSSNDDENEASHQEESPNASCFVSSSASASTLAGILITIASAMIGGAYFVFWGIFSDEKDTVPLTGRSEFIDTHMTLAMIGLCNLIIGWPVLVGAHFAGIEAFQLPPNRTAWWLLLCNGLVEYAFDASCAVAIYMTSPVSVAVVAPLTIPLSMVVENHVYGTFVVEQQPLCTWIGIAGILGGTCLLEYKPSITCNEHSQETMGRYDTESQNNTY